MLLYCAGAAGLFQETCMSLVGSRQLRGPGRAFARRLGAAMAAEGITYVSGGAAGADTEGFQSALHAGGHALLYLADSLAEQASRMKEALTIGRVLLVSEYASIRMDLHKRLTGRDAPDAEMPRASRALPAAGRSTASIGSEAVFDVEEADRDMRYASFTSKLKNPFKAAGGAPAKRGAAPAQRKPHPRTGKHARKQ